MINREVKGWLADYFEANDLVELLRLPVEEVIEAFEDEIEERLDDLLEIMGMEVERDGEVEGGD